MSIGEAMVVCSIIFSIVFGVSKCSQYDHEIRVECLRVGGDLKNAGLTSEHCELDSKSKSK